MRLLLAAAETAPGRTGVLLAGMGISGRHETVGVGKCKGVHLGCGQ